MPETFADRIRELQSNNTPDEHIAEWFDTDELELCVQEYAALIRRQTEEARA